MPDSVSSGYTNWCTNLSCPTKPRESSREFSDARAMLKTSLARLFVLPPLKTHDNECWTRRRYARIFHRVTHTGRSFEGGISSLVSVHACYHTVERHNGLSMLKKAREMLFRSCISVVITAYRITIMHPYGIGCT
jgi:hypothetical protein